jgi:hypothetical protein
MALLCLSFLFCLLNFHISVLEQHEDDHKYLLHLKEVSNEHSCVLQP